MLIVLRENLTLQEINTTPKELKPERDCSHRQLFRPFWGLHLYTLRQPNNYIKRVSPFFSSFSVVQPTLFLGIIKKRRRKGKEKETTTQGLTFLTLINTFNLKDEHYNNISKYKKFGGVSFLL